jgi:alpha-tubulin suppressor-like RCC1 family protein
LNAKVLKSAVAMLLVCLVVAFIETSDAHGATKPVQRTGVLKINISGLERGVIPNVRVTGPRFSRIIKGPVTIKGLTPGNYSLRPIRVVKSNGVETPAPPTFVKVVKGTVTKGTANYYFVPSTTLTISPQQTVSISGPVTGAQTLVLSGSPRSIVPGEILASGPTTSRPDGYLVKVISAAVSGSETTVQVSPATLAEAIPDGSFNLLPVLKEIDSAFLSGTTQSSNFTHASHASAHGLASYSLDCSGTGQISVVPSIGFSFTGANAEVSWNWLNTTGSVSIDYAVSASLAVDASASADCSADVPLLAGAGATIVVDVGIPIALTPTYSVNLDGTASAGGSFSQTLGETLGVHMAANFPPSFSSSVTPQTNVTSVNIQENTSIKLSMTASIGVEVDGLAGVSIDAGPGLNLNVNPVSNPWWTLQGCIDGGFTANILGNTVIDQSTALSWCATLAKASGSLTNTSERVTQINSGALQSCVLLATETVKCWGNNVYGQLGNGSTASSSTPVAVVGLSGVSQIVTNTVQTCAIVSSGAVQCWGHEVDDVTDPLTIGSGSSTPIPVVGLSGVVQISVGAAHACALLKGGTVECWGENYLEQLGNGSTTNSPTPVVVSGVSNAKQISSSGDTNCALIEGGTVKCWGSNYYGSLGDGSTTPLSSTAVNVVGLTNVTQVAVGVASSCALLSSGSVKCWGLNIDGELGNDTTTSSSAPVTVNGLSGVSYISAGSVNICALLTTGSVECWGVNTNGELGDGNTTNSPIPVAVSGLSGATQIAVGDDHSCALLDSGGIECWGGNAGGQLGNGSTTDSSTPVAVEGI